MRVVRLHDSPIITPDLDPSIERNINGPSLIRVPDWLPNPLGRYYLYFAHHQGRFIRLAYADALEGPWTVYAPGTLKLEGSLFRHHIASPDVHVDHERRQIRMYYHGPVTPEDRPKPGEPIEADAGLLYGQRTRVATSTDGIDFDVLPTVITGPYLRVFEWDGWHYGICMPGFLSRSKDGFTGWVHGPRVLGASVNPPDDITHDTLQFVRHMALRIDAEQNPPRLEVYLSRINSHPEHIERTFVPLAGDWTTWRSEGLESVLMPERDWEGADAPQITSRGGAIHEHAWQLRDPCIFEEDGSVFLLYSVAGEEGIAIARIEGI